MKPRVLLTAGPYRLVYNGSTWTHLEVEDGIDRMRARRWQDIQKEVDRLMLEQVVDAIGDALIARSKRKRKRRKGR